jgi:hypothetical protein
MNKPTPRDDVRVSRGQSADVLFRAAAAHVKAYVDGTTAEAAAATTYGASDPSTILLRAASAPATLTNATWAGALAAVAVDDTIAAMTSLSAGADLISRGTKVSLAGIFHMVIPGRVVSAAAAGQWVREGGAIPVRNQVVHSSFLEPRKLAVISTYTQEMAESSNVDAFVRALLSESAGLALDAAMFSNAADDGAHPAGLLYNVTPLTAATGGGNVAMEQDLAALAGALAAAGGGVNAVIVCNPAQATSLKLLAGPRFDTPILAATSVPAKTVILIEASSLVSGFDAVPDFSTSQVALLHYEDTSPQDITGGSPSPAVPVRSLFQTSAIGLRMELKCSWTLRAAGHAQWVQNVTW